MYIEHAIIRCACIFFLARMVFKLSCMYCYCMCVFQGGRLLLLQMHSRALFGKNNKKYFSVPLDDTETRGQKYWRNRASNPKQKSIPVYRHYPEEDVVDKTNNPRKLGDVPNFSSALPDSRYRGQSENSGRSSSDDASSRSSAGADGNHVQHQAPPLQQQAPPQQQQGPPLNYVRPSRPHSESDSNDKNYANVKNPKTYSSYSEDSDECSGPSDIVRRSSTRTRCRR